MEITTQEEVTEPFTITVEELGDGGDLKLIWGGTIFLLNLRFNRAENKFVN